MKYRKMVSQERITMRKSYARNLRKKEIMIFIEGELQISVKHEYIRSKLQEITANSEVKTKKYNQKC